ncbi:hypothetical protein BS50DRAFT_174617 [Corynespora cassiicola Philippines]|uniref:RNA polymerase II assembly factor Rtp1 C-terminal domain-containing protein n=1 Tax=Corynespora cassiicola Philippines TaxID=1448308 RepID=A0A2T2P5H0_CORCC|nr:hypothetical protein BS50DRAFT_174617 [Corynespora cassiicola Philippines]
MGAVEDAVDAAADFVGPFLDKGPKKTTSDNPGHDAPKLVEQAVAHLQAINIAEQASDPNAPYDGSLVGVVYGLLDLVTTLGILPYLSPGVTFYQRPRSVLVSTLPVPKDHNDALLSAVVKFLHPILEQDGVGVQPLLSQRILPDIISAVAELALSPRTSRELQLEYMPVLKEILKSTPTSRLLPILTSFVQQPSLPSWLKPVLSKELAFVPLRPHGVRHTVEFLSLSYLSKNSRVPQDASGPQSKLPIPLEAITQASRLLVSVPSGTNPDQWFTQLAPQLLNLLDGSEGKELSRAAGQIIAGGILNRKTTGAPGTVGWELFARPLLRVLRPVGNTATATMKSISNAVIVGEGELRVALRRMATIVSSYSHAGLIKRLLGPLLLPLWALLNYSKARSSLDKEWRELSRAIMSRYMSISCDPKQIDTITTNLFWDGDPAWTYGPGSQGGVEIRQRAHEDIEMRGVDGIFSRIGDLNARIALLVGLLSDSNINDDSAGTIFLQTTKRWLSPEKKTKTTLVNDSDTDPLADLADAKLSEALATKFKDKFARSPQHIIELMIQILQNFVEEHKSRSKKLVESNKLTRGALENIVTSHSNEQDQVSDNESEDLVSFALSILTTLIASPGFKRDSISPALLSSVIDPLQYISISQPSLPIQPLLRNAAANLLQILDPEASRGAPSDPLAEHRETLKTAMADLTSPEPPNRTWALSAIRKLIKDQASFTLIDVPSTTHMLLSASVADQESYVHTAAIPVLVDLAIRAPNPTLRILVDAFVDIGEQSLRLRKEKEIQEALDFRLRVGEILNNIVLGDDFWRSGGDAATKHRNLKMIVEATLSLASRRGKRKKTLSVRSDLLLAEQKLQEEGEAAWGGPIPNLLDPDAENPAEQKERDELLKIVQGWEDTGIEEDVRIRASALSILGNIFERRLELLSQVTVDAGLQMVIMILSVETVEAKGILRRAAVLVVMGLLRGMDDLLEYGRESRAGLGTRQTDEVERVIAWVRSEDNDGLVRDHAASVIEGLETLRMKKVYKIRDEGLRLGPDLGLSGNLRGLDIQPVIEESKSEKRGPVIEEIE